MRLHGSEFNQLKACVADCVGFIGEQLEAACSPSDQIAATDAAKGIIRYLQSQIARDERLQAHAALAFPFSAYILQPDWQDRWADLAKLPASEFSDEARPLIENLEGLRDVVRELPDSD